MAAPGLLLPRTFTVRTVDSVPADAGVDCSLTLDANQLPMISCWRDAETPDARLLLLTASAPPGAGNPTFAVETIPTRRGTGASLAVQRLSTPGPGGAATVAFKPWVAYYDLEGQSINVAHKEDTGWVIDEVETGVDHFAARGIGIAIGSDGKPRVCYATGRGVTFATRSDAVPRPAGQSANGPRCWQRDSLVGQHWQRRVIEAGRLTTGYDMGVSSTPPPGAGPQPGPLMALSEEADALKMVYRPPSASSSGAVFVTFGKDIPDLVARGKLDLADVTPYASLIVELRGDANRRVNVGIKSRAQRDDSETKVTLTLNADWTTYTIPLSKFTNAELSHLYFMSEFVFTGADPVTAFVRSAQFSDIVVPDIVINRAEPATPAAPKLVEFLRGVGPVAGFDSDIGATPPLPPASSRFTGPDDASASMKIAFPGGRTLAFVTVRPQTAAAVNAAEFQTMLVEMRGSPASSVVRVGIKDVSQRSRGDEVRVPVTLTADWRTYAFPLSLFRKSATVPDLSQLAVVAEFLNVTSTAATVFVRSVRYSTQPATVMAQPRDAASLGGSAVVHASLALDAANTPYICYFDLDSRKLNVAWRGEQFQVALDGTLQRIVGWQVITIPERAGDTFAGEFTSIKVDDQGAVHVAWWSLNGPRYARIRGHAPLLVESIENTNGAGMYISLDLRSFNGALEPEVAYYDPASGGRLKVARRGNGQWVAPEIPDSSGNVGGFASLKLDPSARPVIAYYDFGRRVIRVATSGQA